MFQPAFNRSELLLCSRGILFGANTPKLPAPPLLAFDEVVEIDKHGGKYGHGYALARKKLGSMSWVFDSHFYRDPIMPGTMMIEGLLQLAGFFGAYAGGRGRGRAARVERIRFLNEVTPVDREILYRVDIRKCNVEHTLIVADGKVTAGGVDRTTVGSLWVVVKDRYPASTEVTHETVLLDILAKQAERSVSV
jgi:3-hydroxyacyl-[acyl-carrier protein] dehydratase / trans-2-decenoyl-[acyl-carrier protein] isomerase